MYLEFFHYNDLYYGFMGNGWKLLTIVPNIGSLVNFTVPSEIKKVVQGSRIWVPSGTFVSYSVSSPGCITETGSVVVVDNETLYIELKESMPTITVNSIPISAYVQLIASGYLQQGNSITVPYGTEVAYTLSNSGYNPVVGSIIVTRTETITISMLE